MMRLNINHAVILFAGVALGFSLAWAGGSFDRDDTLLPVLKQQPELAKYLLDTLEIAPGGGAVRIGSRVSESLGGMRIGPYEIAAKPKGMKGPYIFHLTVTTEQKFYRGRRLLTADEGADGATSVTEKLQAVTIKVIDPAARLPLPAGEK